MMFDADWMDLLRFHRFLLAATHKRLERYERALLQTVKAGDVILDLGSGTGILAFLACRAGARKVYAIDETDAIELARLLADRNDGGDQITFIRSASVLVDLPERADVLVADIFGTFGLQPGGLAAIVDARDRLMRVGATCIPRAIELYAAPVEAADFYEHTIEDWSTKAFGVDLSPIRHHAINNCYPIRIEPAALLADAASLAYVRLDEVQDLLVSGEAHVTIARRGVLHGVCGWFAADLVDGIRVDNAPGGTTTNYAQAFFPLARPALVEQGDNVRLAIQSYDAMEFTWHIDVNGRPQAPGATRLMTKFEHSTLWGFPLSKEQLRRIVPAHAPTLSRSGEAKCLVLSLCNGQRTLDALAARLLDEFPGLVRSQREALAFVRSALEGST